MAVPKKKTSPSRKGNRRTKLFKFQKRINVMYDENGHPRLPHRPGKSGEYKDGINFYGTVQSE